MEKGGQPGALLFAEHQYGVGEGGVGCGHQRMGL